MEAFRPQRAMRGLALLTTLETRSAVPTLGVHKETRSGIPGPGGNVFKKDVPGANAVRLIRLWARDLTEAFSLHFRFEEICY